jgi:diguanylate cyclase (GGDEF)-like protein/PAS domain S-box-containing protein
MGTSKSAHAFISVLLEGLAGRDWTEGMHRLEEAAARIGAGDTSVRTDLERADALGVLSRAFDAMAEALDHSIRELRQAEGKYHQVFNGSPDALMLFEAVPAPGRGFRLTDMNPAAGKLTGVPPAAAIESADGSVFPEPWIAHLGPLLRQCTETSAAASREGHFDAGSGLLNIESVVLPLPGEPAGRLLAMTRDITKEVSARQIAAAITQSPVPMVITGIDGTIEYVNQAFCTNSQYRAEELIGGNPRLLKGGETSREEYASMWTAIRGGNPWHGTFHNRRKDGSLVWEDVVIAPVQDAAGAITRFTGMKQDVTARRRAEQQSEYLAHYDALTGLPNRLLGKDRMERAIVFAARARCKAALIFLDIDRFKQVNNTLGHAAGDAVLKAAGGRLQFCTRGTDTVARQDGDEFLAVLAEVRDIESIGAVSHTILGHLTRPFVIDGRETCVTASIGIAVYPDDGADWDTLLKKAIAAMYAAKEAGGNTWRFSCGQMNTEAAEYLRMRETLQNGLLNGEFLLHYQPQASLKSGGVAGVEALLRWNCPQRGLMTPDSFMTLAEDSGLIVPIGDWALRETCRQAAAWHKAGLPKIPVAVNVSAAQFRSGDVPGSVARALNESGLDPACLELEITETAFLADIRRISGILRELKDMGAGLTASGFGTGTSSLSFLQQSGVAKVKIDRSIIRGLPDGAESLAVVDAAVHMARGLGVTAVAEGVENKAVLDELRRHGCDSVQGFYYARPMPAAQMAAFLNSPDKGLL